jgi:hypothetical protein
MDSPTVADPLGLPYSHTYGPGGGRDGPKLTHRFVRLGKSGLYEAKELQDRPGSCRDGTSMGFDQYHEPAGELSAETRTFARMIASLTEEAEAIGWYEQRMSVEPDKQARAIMENAQQEEFKHFAMDLEFLTRRTEKWRIALKTTMFTDGDIVEAGERAEQAEGLE